MKLRLLVPILFLFISFKMKAQEEVYEFRTYQLEFFRSATILHNYFENALIPALNRQGVKTIGAFAEYDNRLPKKIYLLIAHKNIEAFQDSKDLLAKDTAYLADADTYLKADEALIAFNNISTSLIRSTYGFPKLIKPTEKASLFELRIYESHNEDALRRKVKMFNKHEFTIFEEVGLPIVFFGFNIAGERMPCLTYLLAFKDMATHREAWSKFGTHPEWQRILKLEEYANNMNDITRIFLKPLPYSQL